MHPNAVLLEKLFTSLDQHDHHTMARCYHPVAVFTDIAFDLHSKKRIHAMWDMICRGDIRVTVEALSADDSCGQARLVDEYTFSSTKRKVRNVIDSRFQFKDGLIAEHHDFCDARQWASMALGGVTGFLAGRFRFLRSYKARKLLDAFTELHPEYR